jgi:hypothetical protein
MKHLTREATDLLEQTTGLKATCLLDERGADDKITLYFADKKYTWRIDVKNRFTRPVFARMMQDNVIKGEDKLLVAPYINESLATLCRENGLNYIDLAGNMYLRRPPVFIDIRGRKPAPERQDELARQRVGKAFQPKGMKLVMMLLLNPALVNQPMRVLAGQAEVALGTVKQVLDDLKYLTFIVDKGKKGKQLTELDLLLTRWLDAYPHNLDAKLDQVLYTTNDMAPLMGAKLEDFNALWGGEVAAGAYTHYLTPKTYLIYADKHAQKTLLKDFRLRRLQPHERTDNLIRLVTPPVGIEKLKGPQKGLVTPLLVYADLLNSNDPRNLETAKRLYDDYLA